MKAELEDVQLSVFSDLCAEISVFHNITVDNNLKAFHYDWYKLAETMKHAIQQFRTIQENNK